MDALSERDDFRTTNSRFPHSGSQLRILFAISSWGLGHATRDLPVIQRMLERGHDVTIVSSDRAMTLLRQELGRRCSFLEWPDRPFPLSKSALRFYAKFVVRLPLALWTIFSEHHALSALLRANRFDRIISDSRFGVRSSKIASYHLSHGLRLIAPGRSVPLEYFMEYAFRRLYGRTARFVVPDYSTDSLSGELSHNLRFVRTEHVSYVGILSSIRKQPFPEDIDYYISISGPEPQRTILEDLTLRQVHDVPGRVVVSLGKPEEAGQSWTEDNVTVYNYVNRCQQQEFMNRARLVVSRSGYTTMMELAELGKQALLIPTPGQTEQEYLATRHLELGNFYSVRQEHLDLPRDLKIAREYSGYVPSHRTEESIERFMAVVTS